MAQLLAMLGIGGAGAGAGGAAAGGATAGAGAATGAFLKELGGELATANLSPALASNPQAAGAALGAPRPSLFGRLLEAYESGRLPAAQVQAGDTSGGRASFVDLSAQANPFLYQGRPVALAPRPARSPGRVASIAPRQPFA